MISQAISVNRKMSKDNNIKFNTFSFNKYEEISYDTFSLTSNKNKIICDSARSVSFGNINILINLKDLPCPCCGKILIPKTTAHEYSAKVSYFKGKELIEALNEYKQILPEAKQKLVDRIIMIGNKHPDKSIGEIIAILNTKKIIIIDSKNSIKKEILPPEVFIHNQMKHSLYIIQKANNLVGDSKNFFDVEYKQLHSFIYGKKNKPIFDKQYLLKRIQGLIDNNRNINDNKALHQIKHVAQQLNDVEQIFISYLILKCDKDKSLIVNKLIQSNIATIDHIIPVSKEGKNTFDNVIIMCHDCNNEKAAENIDNFIKNKVDIRINAEKHIEFIKNNLNLSDFKLIETYIANISKIFLKN